MRLERPTNPTTRHLMQVAWSFGVLNLAMLGIGALLYPLMGVAALVLFPGTMLFVTLLLSLLWAANYLVSRWLETRRDVER